MRIIDFCYIVASVMFLVCHYKINSKIHEHMLKISHLEHQNKAIWSFIKVMHSKVDPTSPYDASKDVCTKEIKRDYLDGKIRM